MKSCCVTIQMKTLCNTLSVDELKCDHSSDTLIIVYASAKLFDLHEIFLIFNFF